MKQHRFSQSEIQFQFAKAINYCCNQQRLSLLLEIETLKKLLQIKKSKQN